MISEVGRLRSALLLQSLSPARPRRGLGGIVTGMGEEFTVGDRIEWWSDNDGSPAEPGDPDPKKHTETVASVHRHPDDDN